MTFYQYLDTFYGTNLSSLADNGADPAPEAGPTVAGKHTIAEEQELTSLGSSGLAKHSIALPMEYGLTYPSEPLDMAASRTLAMEQSVFSEAVIEGQRPMVLFNPAQKFSDPYVLGDDEDNILYGDEQGNIIRGFGGDDEMFGLDGDDQMFGGDGDDHMEGGDGFDWLEGGEGDDTYDGGALSDWASFLTNADMHIDLQNGVATGEGNDTLISIENADTGMGTGNDTMFGSDVRNILNSGVGDDILFGFLGDDALQAGGGNDFLSGGEGDDYVNGAYGSDILLGDEGDDELKGFQDDDLLIGGLGSDEITGGTGSDVFRWRPGDLGMDTLVDFTLGEDLLDFADNFLAEEIGLGVAWTDVFLTVYAGADTLLAANTAEAGWQWIARLEGITQEEAIAAFDEGSILADSDVDGFAIPPDPADAGGGWQIAQQLVEFETDSIWM